MQWGKMPFEDLYNMVYDHVGPFVAFLAVMVLSFTLVLLVVTFFGCFYKAFEVIL